MPPSKKRIFKSGNVTLLKLKTGWCDLSIKNWAMFLRATPDEIRSIANVCTQMLLDQEGIVKVKKNNKIIN